MAEKAGRPPERLIAGGVPLPIVDPFQVVDVGDQHRESVSRHTAGARNFLGQAHVGVTTVPQARQRVLVGDPPERFLLRQLPPQTGVRLAQSREPSIGALSSVDHQSPPRLDKRPIRPTFLDRFQFLAFLIGDHPDHDRTRPANVASHDFVTKHRVNGSRMGGMSIANRASRLVRS